jgi:ubiquinone/menaquinone biosynthesis C-methylase UbiE
LTIDLSSMDLNPNRALWEKGDFTRIAEFMRESGDVIAHSLGLAVPARVLDLGCGDGTTALPLARLGAEVLGVDIASNLVEAGLERARRAGLANLRFQQGDACRLEVIADHSFDLTISIFGAMFAPKPAEVAREMVRVTKPGGRVVMGNWIPDDPTSFVSQLLKISSEYASPPPQGFVSPMLWGTEAHVRERFEGAGVAARQISTIKDTYHFISENEPPERFVELLEQFYGPTMNAVAAAEKSGQTELLHQQLCDLARHQNRSTGAGTRIPATFLRVTVQL